MSERQDREKRMLEFLNHINTLTEQINHQKSKLQNMKGLTIRFKSVALLHYSLWKHPQWISVLLSDDNETYFEQMSKEIRIIK